MPTAQVASSLNNTWFLFSTESRIHGSLHHSCVAVRSVAPPVIVLVFFAVRSPCSWLMTYITPFPCLSHTASANPSVMSSRATCPPCGLNGQSLYVHPRSTFFQQIVNHLLLSWYFGNLGKSLIETLPPLKISRMAKRFPPLAKTGSIKALIFCVSELAGVDPLGSTWLWAWIGSCPVSDPWVCGFIAMLWCLWIRLWHVTSMLRLYAYLPFAQKSWAMNHFCKHDFVHDKAKKQAWRVSPMPWNQILT